MVSIINRLCKEQNISISDLESKLGFGNGAIYKWKTSSPKAENLQKIADYFNVSVDYLLGREERAIMSKSLDNDTMRLIQSFDKLSPPNKQRLLAYLDGLHDAK